MIFPFPIFYICCFQDEDFCSAVDRLTISLSSLPSKSNIHILTWHECLPNHFSSCQLDITFHLVNKISFSKSYFINKILYISNSLSFEYFYLSDTDLFFHSLYFDWLMRMYQTLSGDKNDLRIITTNYNIYPYLRIPLIPFKAYSRLMSCFPVLFDWTLPNSLSSIYSRYLCSPDFAHGCGLVPVKLSIDIGGYNSEMIGYGPEDDLFNQRLKFYARVYYHKGCYSSSTFHLPHKPLQQQNKRKNWNTWRDTMNYQSFHGVFSDTIKRTFDFER